MKPLPVALLSILLLHGAAAVAQGVYVIQGESGPVFSDKPQPGARELRLPPLNVVTPPARPDAAPAAAPAESVVPQGEASAYRSFSIVQPENYASVPAGTAPFAVRLAVDPPLQAGLGHAFVVRINGRMVAQRFTASEFTIAPEFWGEVPPPPTPSLQLDASIIDRAGRELNKAGPVRFFMH